MSFRTGSLFRTGYFLRSLCSQVDVSDKVKNHVVNLFNDQNMDILNNFKIPQELILELMFHRGSVGGFSSIDQIKSLNIIFPETIDQIISYCDDIMTKNIRVVKKYVTDLSEYSIVTGIDYSEKNLSWASVDTNLNLIDFKSIDTNLPWKNPFIVGKEVYKFVKDLPYSDIYIIELAYSFASREPGDEHRNFLRYFHLIDYCIKLKLNDYNRKGKRVPLAFHLPLTDFCIITGLPDMLSQKRYIASIITSETLKTACERGNINAVKMLQKRTVDNELLYESRNLATQFQTNKVILNSEYPPYFEELVKKGVGLRQFCRYFEKLNVTNFQKDRYFELDERHDISDCIWLGVAFLYVNQVITKQTNIESK